MVLVVEDEDALRTMAVRVLRDAGYRVVAAESEERALALASAEAIDVLLTDVIMPGIGGIALADRIRDMRSTTRVVYMSGYPRAHLILERPASGGICLRGEALHGERASRGRRERCSGASYRSYLTRDVSPS